MDNNIVDFIIVGAGISGLATGLALTKKGYKVKIFEEAEVVRRIGAGLTLWSNALKAFDHLELLDEILEIGIHIENSALRNSKLKIIKQFSVEDVLLDVGYPILTVARGTLLDVLASQINSEIEFQKKFTSYKAFEDHVIAEFSDGTQVKGKYLLGCDGINSVVRDQLYIQNSQKRDIKRYSGYAAWRGMVRLDEKQYYQYKLLVGEYWGKGTRFGLTALPNNYIYWFAVHNVSLHELNGRKELDETKTDVLCQTFAVWDEIIQQLIQLSIANGTEILYHPIFDLKPGNDWGDNNVLLLGDAAHATTPNMGQGACLAIEDAITLGQLLQEQNTSPASDVLGTYRTRRRNRVNYIVNTSWSIGKVGQWSNPILCSLRNIFTKFTPTRIFKNRLRKTLNTEFNA